MITDLLQARAAQTPHATFLATDFGQYSFSDVLDAVRKFAQRIHESGVGEGDHVALLADNSAPYVIALLAISWLGAVPVALNNELVADGLCYSLEQSDSTVIIADARWMREKEHFLNPQLRLLNRLQLMEEVEFFSFLATQTALHPGARVPAHANCTLLYTSGTTGLPKGVVNSHECYEAVGRDTVVALQLSAADRIMVFLPLFHTNPQMYALMSALTCGASLILRPRFSASNFFEDARRFGATGFTFVGTVLSILVARHTGKQQDHSLRFAIGGGAPAEVWQAVHDRFGFRVHELYGMTEIGGWVSCNTASAYRFGSCGQVRPSMDVRIFDQEDHEVEAGKQGEIVVRPINPNVIYSGYYRNPEATLASSRNLWFHTGDRGSKDAQGFLYFHGRFKELIRRGGEMISPVEIETKLRAMPGIADCAVVGVPDAVMGEEIKAVVMLSSPVSSPAASRVLAESISAYLRPSIPTFMLPRYIEIIDVIPKTETEKILRHKLQYLNDAVHDLAADSTAAAKSMQALN